MKYKVLLLALSALVFSQNLYGASPSVSGKDLFSQNEISISAGVKGQVVVFLSSVCPCSDSHVEELKKLFNDFPDFSFVGVHSNMDEKKEATLEYFKKLNLPFPIIRDSDLKIANQFKAYKTPHAFVLSKQQEHPVYEGGVSNSKSFENADRNFLREALINIANHKPVKTPKGRTLGCVISREKKYVW